MCPAGTLRVGVVASRDLMETPCSPGPTGLDRHHDWTLGIGTDPQGRAASESSHLAGATPRAPLCRQRAPAASAALLPLSRLTPPFTGLPEGLRNCAQPARAPQGLCTGWSLCLEGFVPKCPHSLFPPFFQASSPASPCWRPPDTPCSLLLCPAPASLLLMACVTTTTVSPVCQLHGGRAFAVFPAISACCGANNQCTVPTAATRRHPCPRGRGGN